MTHKHNWQFAHKIGSGYLEPTYALEGELQSGYYEFICECDTFKIIQSIYKNGEWHKKITILKPKKG